MDPADAGKTSPPGEPGSPGGRSDGAVRIIRLEEEVRALRYQLAVREAALRTLNARLVRLEGVARGQGGVPGADQLEQQLALMQGSVAWALATKIGRVRRRLAPEGSGRARMWGAVRGWVLTRLR